MSVAKQLRRAGAEAVAQEIEAKVVAPWAFRDVTQESHLLALDAAGDGPRARCEALKAVRIGPATYSALKSVG